MNKQFFNNIANINTAVIPAGALLAALILLLLQLIIDSGGMRQW